jgi:hypothetical protein
MSKHENEDIYRISHAMIAEEDAKWFLVAFDRKDTELGLTILRDPYGCVRQAALRQLVDREKAKLKEKLLHLPPEEREAAKEAVIQEIESFFSACHDLEMERMAALNKGTKKDE